MAHENGPDIFASAVPDGYQKYVDKLRDFLNDKEQLNDLLEDEESTDLELYQALAEALDEINTAFDPTSVHYKDFKDVPSWSTLQLGGVLKVLLSKGILSARNTLNYNDSGGISVKENDEYGRYTHFFNLLVNKYARQVRSMKRATNINSCYGGEHSPYNNL